MEFNYLMLPKLINKTPFKTVNPGVANFRKRYIEPLAFLNGVLSSMISNILTKFEGTSNKN
ncbi:hypothetical protein CsSME_00017441 [Camellia sinensis var. sinensis]